MKTGFAGGLALLPTFVLVIPFAVAQPASSGHSAIDPGGTTTIDVPASAPTMPSPDEDTQAGRTTALVEVQSAAAASQSLESDNRNFSQRITFDEFPEGTMTDTLYRDRGIILGGSGPVITDDLGAPSPPVLAGTPLFEGDITGQFVLPGTDQPAPVYLFTWEIGRFDAVQSVQMDIYGPSGQTLYSITNTDEGYFRYTVRGGNIGIASWRFHIVADEPAGFGIDNLVFSIPGMDDLAREMGEPECGRGNPVNPAAGNKYQKETDYKGSRPFPLEVSRAYNSISGSWRFFPEIRHEPGTIEASVVRSDGKVLSYTGYPENSDWSASSTDITGELSSSRDTAGNIIGWQFKTLDDRVEAYDSAGRLLSVTLRSGLSHTYSYSADEITVTHSLGGSLIYGVDPAGRIMQFRDPAGQIYSYSYNSTGMLNAVSYPAGSGGRSYHYENANHLDLLTGISDANGDRYATWAYDDSRRTISSEHYNGADRTIFDYSYLEGPGTSRTTVTNPLGKQATYYYTRVNGVQRVFHVSGHPSANCVAANQSYQFDGNAFIRSKTDWEGNVTEYVRDNKGRELVRTEAPGTQSERTTLTDWHPQFNLPLRIIEPGRETHFTYDSKGNQISKQLIDTTTP